jgi:hypothetical protein
VQAVDGKLMADFEPMFPPRRSDEYGYPAWRTDGMFPIGALRSSMLEAMTQQTGLVFRREWLDKKLPTYRIPIK